MKRRPQRSRVGVRGADPDVTIRLPYRTKSLLDALNGMTGVPINRLVQQAVDRYVKGLSAAERRLLKRVKIRRRRTPRD